MNTEMGVKVNGTAIPDPSEWEYEVASLDLSGARAATGRLHREMVATKINYTFNWKGLYWNELQAILNAIQGEMFTLTAPDPLTFKGTRSGDYYVGDRTGKSYYYWKDTEKVALFTLSLKFIEF